MVPWSTLGLGLVVVGPFVLFLLRRPIGRVVSAAAQRGTRSLGPGIVWRSAKGPGSGVCPRCKAPVSCSKMEPGGTAFACANCSETATWT